MDRVSENDDFEQIINRIFRIDENAPDRLVTRESSSVEFKANFSRNRNTWNSYGKTIAAFANAKGGCLVFGVSDRPRRLDGMSNNYFESLDPQELTNFLNEKFSPEIRWSLATHEIEDKKFGILLVEENVSKPVMAIANGGDKIFEAEIYYRYRGRSEKIKYPELQEILDSQRQKEQDLWMRHLQRIATIGVHDAAIFNPDDGTVSGKGGTFIIDRKLLPKLSFIREGEFREVTGAPAIKIVGEAQILAAGEITGTEYIERKAIRMNEIIEFFLLQKMPSEPTFFIEQACYEQSGFLPLYYYAGIEGLDFHELKQIIDSQNSRNQSKNKILERLASEDKSLYMEIPDTGTTSAMTKDRLRKAFIEKTLDDSEIEDFADIRYRLEALRSLEKHEIDIDYIFPILSHYYKTLWDGSSTFRDSLRKAICYLDKELFCPDDFYR